jgi:hypothetical protein
MHACMHASCFDIEVNNAIDSYFSVSRALQSKNGRAKRSLEVTLWLGTYFDAVLVCVQTITW